MPLTSLLLPGLLLVSASDPRAAVAAVLDDWHRAAASADGPRYFGHMAEEAVFLGSDGTERWDKRAFQAFAQPHFAHGKGWTFTPTRRAIAWAAGGSVAWFDEDLASTHMGPCRGSGLLERRDGTWKLLQYNLSVPIPNALLKDVKAQIAAHGARSKQVPQP